VKRLAAVLAGLLVSGCSPSSPEIDRGLLPPWCRVYFTPADPVPAEMVSLIDSARERVWAAFYSFSLDEVARALVRARARGVDVRVVMDDLAARPPDSASHRLAELGILKTDFTPSVFMHHKFMIIDSRITWTGSYNPGVTGSFRDDNNAIVIASKELAANYEEEFLDLWRGRFSGGSREPTARPRLRVGRTRVESYFAPRDPCAARLIELIRGAEKEIRFAAFAFTLEPVAAALIERHLAGVDVRGVMERGQESPWNCRRIFADAGMAVRWDQNLYYLHHKFFVIDGRTVITGSFNPTKQAQTANNENMLIVHHAGVAKKYLDEFDRLWERWWE